MNKKIKRSKNFIEKIIEKDLLTQKNCFIKTRFPPEPNGYLHIGHAKSICLNFGIAKQYHGKCNLRLDDTNPDTGNIKYINSIKKDIKWLGFNWDNNTKYSSDYFDFFYKYAIELIKKQLAYIDELSTQNIKKYRGTLKKPGENSPFRNRTIAENLYLFEKMKNGFFKEGQACLRAKIDMSSSFIIMRDPVLYRIKFTKHHQLKNKWCIYPTYDFSHCIADALERITHSLCTLEFQDNRQIYDWIIKHISIKFTPKQYEFSRLNLSYSITSKRKLNKIIENNVISDWDDPRMPTISGLRRRGYTPNSILEFCNRIGISKQDSLIPIDTLETCIREDLNNNAPRAMAVLNPIKVIIENFREGHNQTLLMQNHPRKLNMGTRIVPFTNLIYIDKNDFCEQHNPKYKKLSLGKKVRLRNAYVIKANKVDKDESGNIITIYCTYYPDTLNQILDKKNKIQGIIHWVSAIYGIPTKFRLYEHLFKIKNPNLEKNFLKFINKDSLIVKNGFVEPSLIKATPEKNYQFEREGYFCLDNKIFEKNFLIFNRTITLKNLKNKKFKTHKNC